MKKLEITTIRHYIQKEEAAWVGTPIGTIWIDMPESIVTGNYIQPEDISLRNTLLGINLDLVDDDVLEKIFDITEVTNIKL